MAALVRLWRGKPRGGSEVNNLTIILVLIQKDYCGLLIGSEKHNLLILKSLKFEIPGAKD